MKGNGDILVNIVMVSIGDWINNIYGGNFLGWTHEVKTQFIIICYVLHIPLPREEILFSAFKSRNSSQET